MTLAVTLTSLGLDPFLHEVQRCCPPAGLANSGDIWSQVAGVDGGFLGAHGVLSMGPLPPALLWAPLGSSEWGRGWALRDVVWRSHSAKKGELAVRGTSARGPGAA